MSPRSLKISVRLGYLTVASLAKLKPSVSRTSYYRSKRVGLAVAKIKKASNDGLQIKKQVEPQHDEHSVPEQLKSTTAEVHEFSKTKKKKFLYFVLYFYL